MRELHVGNGVLLTTESVAHAVIEYTRALLRAGSEGVLDIPVVRADGSVGSAQLLLGGRDSLWSTDTPFPAPVDVDDERALAELRQRTALLDRRPRYAGHADRLEFFDSLDL